MTEPVSPQSYLKPKPPDPVEFGFMLNRVMLAGGAQENVLQAPANEHFWHIEVYGDVDLLVTWGRKGLRRVLCDAPLIGDFPGNVEVYATPRGVEQAPTLVTTMITQATAVGPQEFRRFVTAAVAPVAFEDEATGFQSLDIASVLNVRGQLVGLTQGQRVGVIVGSILTVGSGFVEFTP